MTNLLLIQRCEIVCLLMLIYLFCNSKLYRLGKDERIFSKLSICALIHVVFDILTVYTVNHTEQIPSFLNWCCHIIFYLSAIFYSYYLLVYILQIGSFHRYIDKFQRITLCFIGVYIVLLPFLSMHYLQGDGTKYSMGTAAQFGYGIAILIFITCTVLLFMKRKVLGHHKFFTLFPTILLLIICELLQIIIPELLFTGSCLTIVTIGIFFSLENPILALQQKAYLDTATSFLNKNSFLEDFEQYNKQFQKMKQKSNVFHFVYCDINNLKNINDTFGHLTGDACINDIAGALLHNMASAKKLYRLGGDEFLIMYYQTPVKQVMKEMRETYAECSRLNKLKEYEISIALGYASSSDDHEDLEEVIRQADHNMYQNKLDIKKVLKN